MIRIELRAKSFGFEECRTRLMVINLSLVPSRSAQVRWPVPARRPSLISVLPPDGKNTTLAWASAKDDAWKPTLEAPGLDEQTYQIMCDAIDLPAAQLGNQMYLGEITCIWKRYPISATDILCRYEMRPLYQDNRRHQCLDERGQGRTDHVHALPTAGQPGKEEHVQVFT